jgi:hypothetical protein
LLYRFRPDYWWWGLAFLLRQTILAFSTVLPINNPHAQLMYTGGTLAVYGFLVCRFWPWISRELSSIDAGTMLSLVLLMLAASQYLPEPPANSGRTGTLVGVFMFTLVLFLRFFAILIRGIGARGIKGEFDAMDSDRKSISKMWLQWLEYSHEIPNSEIVETICQMNEFDRVNLLSFMSSWNAATGQGVKGTRLRLSGLSSRAKVRRKESIDTLAQSSSRISAQDFGGQPVDQNGQYDIDFPRALCVLGSDGAAPDAPGAKFAKPCEDDVAI